MKKHFIQLILLAILLCVLIWGTFYFHRVKSSKNQKIIVDMAKYQTIKGWIGSKESFQNAIYTLEQLNNKIFINNHWTKDRSIGWLRRMLENSGLELINYKKIKSGTFKLELKGDELEFWNFYLLLKKKAPWVNVNSMRVSSHSKSFLIQEFEIDIYSYTENQENDTLNFDRTWEEELVQIKIEVMSSLADKKIAVKTPLFNHSKEKEIHKNQKLPKDWVIKGVVPKKGVSILNSKEIYFWLSGQDFKKWKLLKVESENILVKSPQGDTIEVNW